MNVLICDDDASTRFVIKRLLTQHLHCTTIECDDGVETLRKLDEGDIDLVVLDVEMPFVDGIEVLEAIRSSPRLKTLPVLMLSKERREDVIVRLVRLGVEGYILKPPRADKVLAALDRLRSSFPGRGRSPRGNDPNAVRLGPDSPALLIDGNLDFRHFFVSHGARFGPIAEAASGAAGLAQFRQSPTRLVFLGSELGVLGPDLLVPKLRAMAGTEPLHVVGILDEGQAADGRSAIFDEVIARSFLPDKLSAALRPFTESAPVPPGQGATGAAGVLTAIAGLTGDLPQGIASAMRQVFGMMLDAELEDIEAVDSTAPMIAAVCDITIQERYAVQLAIRSTVESMTAIAGRMLGMETADVGVEDYLSTCTELANLLCGRIHANLEERSVASECSLPVVQREAAPWGGAFGADGIVLRFRLCGTTAEVTVSASAGQVVIPAESTLAAAL